MLTNAKGFYSRLHGTLTWRVLTNASWISAATPITVGLGIVQIGMMARMLGPEGLGVIGLFEATCAFISALLKLNSGEASMVFATKALAEGDKKHAGHLLRYFYLLDFLTSFLSFSAVVASGLIFSQLFKISPEHGWLISIYGLTLIFRSPHSIAHSVLRVGNHFSWIFYQSAALSVLKTVSVLVLFLAKAGLEQIVLLLVSLSLFDGCSSYLMAEVTLRQKGVSISRSLERWWRVPKYVLKFQILAKGRDVTKMLYRYSDTLMIGFLASATSIGLFRSAKQITGLLSIPTDALVSSLSPEYSRLWFQDDVARLRKLVFRFSMTIFCIFTFVVFWLIIFIEPIIRLILGVAFLPAKETVFVLILTALISMVMAPFNSMQVATGRAGPATLAGVATVVVQAILMVFLVPKFGIVGAAWASVAGVTASAAIMIPTGLVRLKGKGSIV